MWDLFITTCGQRFYKIKKEYSFGIERTEIHCIRLNEVNSRTECPKITHISYNL